MLVAVLVLCIGTLSCGIFWTAKAPQPLKVELSEFRDHVQSGRVASAVITNQVEVEARLKSGEVLLTTVPSSDPDIVDLIRSMDEAGVRIEVKQEPSGWLRRILLSG